MIYTTSDLIWKNHSVYRIRIKHGKVFVTHKVTDDKFRLSTIKGNNVKRKVL